MRVEVSPCSIPWDEGYRFRCQSITVCIASLITQCNIPKRIMSDNEDELEVMFLHSVPHKPSSCIKLDNCKLRTV